MVRDHGQEHIGFSYSKLLLLKLVLIEYVLNVQYCIVCVSHSFWSPLAQLVSWMTQICLIDLQLEFELQVVLDKVWLSLRHNEPNLVKGQHVGVWGSHCPRRLKFDLGVSWGILKNLQVVPWWSHPPDMDHRWLKNLELSIRDAMHFKSSIMASWRPPDSLLSTPSSLYMKWRKEKSAGIYTLKSDTKHTYKCCSHSCLPPAGVRW